MIQDAEVPIFHIWGAPNRTKGDVLLFMSFSFEEKVMKKRIIAEDVDAFVLEI